MNLTTTFEFAAGHRLMNHPSGCRNLHGHNYRLDVSICGEIDQHTGMVCDFSTIRKSIRKWIEAHWDHHLILNREDPLINILPKDLAVALLPGEPTAELMALFLLQVLPVPAGTRISSVRVWETSNACAEVCE